MYVFVYFGYYQFGCHYKCNCLSDMVCYMSSGILNTAFSLSCVPVFMNGKTWL